MNLATRRMLSRAAPLALTAMLATPAMAQLRIGEQHSPPVPRIAQPRTQSLPGQQIATIELGLAPVARKQAAHMSLREVLRKGLVVRYDGREPVAVRYVGYVLHNGRVVDRVSSSPTMLEPGAHRVPGDQFIPGDQFVPGDQFIPGDQFVPGDQFIPGDQFVPGDQFRARKGERFLVLFVLPEDAGQRKLAKIRPLVIKLDAP